MKKLLLILTLSLVFLYSNAQQPFCPPGAVWHYNYTFPPLVPIFQDIYYKYTGDATIANKVCHQVQKVTFEYTSGVLTNTYYAPKINIYQDGDTVFWYRNGAFVTLFNFGAQSGDQWVVDNQITNPNCDAQSVLQVTNATTNTISSQLLRLLSVDTVNQATFGFHGDIYERIGPVGNNDLFPMEQNCDPSVIIDFGTFNFICYQDSNFVYPGGNCSIPPVGIVELDREQFSISPNPSSGKVRLNSEREITDGDLQIFDMAGMHMFAVSFTGIQAELDLDLAPGIYIVKLQDKTLQKVGKLIIK